MSEQDEFARMLKEQLRVRPPTFTEKMFATVLAAVITCGGWIVMGYFIHYGWKLLGE